MLGCRLRVDSMPIHFAVLLALSLPYCINLGKSSIWDANEAFYAETPREMLITGNYLSPQFNFQPRAQKPPLTYWAILGSYKILGVNEFSVRFPSALAAMGVLLFAYGTSRLLFGPRAALISAAITATTPRIFILARRLPIDILLLFFLTGSLFFIVHAIQKGKRSRWALVYASASLGFLTKGPIAVVIPAVALFGWMLWARKLKTFKVYSLMGVLVFSGIVLPWYVLIYKAHGWTYIINFFLRDNLGRFATESFGPSRGIAYYFSVYAADFFPWSLLSLMALCFLWLDRRKEQPLKNLEFGLPLIWCAFVFVAFSMSKNKQEYYIAPIYPAIAVILSGLLDKCTYTAYSRSFSRRNRNALPHEVGAVPQSIPARRMAWWARSFGLLAFLIALLSLLMPYVLKSFMPNLPPVLHYAPSLVLMGGATLLAFGIILKKFVLYVPALAVPLWSVFLMGAVFYVPALESLRPVKSFCRLIEAHSSGDEEAGFFRTALPSMVYYLRRPIFEETDTERMAGRFRSNRRVFCVLSEKDYAYFANRNIKLYVLGRHSHFAVRLRALWNTNYYPTEELFLVSNQPFSEIRSGEGSPTS